MAEWKEYKLGEVIKLYNGKSRPKEGGEYPVYGGNGILDYANSYNYTGETIIIGRVGAYCGSIYFENNPIWVSDNALVGKPQNGYNAVFVYYLLKNFRLNEYAEGSSHPLLTQGLINDLDVLFTNDTIEQEAIAEVLSSLDDKIDLLHRQNKTLESMAETLFRQWFIEEVQEDWEEGKIGDLFTLHRGYDLATQHRGSGRHPLITASGVNDYVDDYKVKGPGVITGRSGLLGKVFYSDVDFWPLNTTLYISEFKRATPLFAYYFLKTWDLATFNAGSAVPTLNRNHVHNTEIALPKRELIEQFEKVALSNHKKIKSNQSQIHTLTQLRDTLLPKLMSGEVRVKG